MAKLISREPWWAKRPTEGQQDKDVDWGYLEIYDDCSFQFDPTRPTDEEIANRKSCRIAFPHNKKASI